MTRSVLVVLALGLLGLASVAAAAEKAASPEQAWIVATEIKPRGEMTCDKSGKHQTMATVATFKDAAGKTRDVELARWEQVTEGPCSGPKTRGGQESGPPTAAEIAKAKTAMQSEGKTKGGPCGCFYQYWYLSDCVYYKFYDCDWNYCGWRCVPY
jgi:hypothetical protein